jgi:hypothetical protein
MVTAVLRGPHAFALILSSEVRIIAVFCDRRGGCLCKSIYVVDYEHGKFLLFELIRVLFVET